MLFYLDNASSGRKGVNENYARELMELHTLGVDGGYTQKDVTEVARAFTGWTISRRSPQDDGGFRFARGMHEPGPKTMLGHTIKENGEKEGEQVLDILAGQPATARFISTKLAQRFVSDDPPASLVDRAARRFHDTHGNLREVVKTIVTSPEFFAPEARNAKVKTPLEFVASALRSAGSGIGDPGSGIRDPDPDSRIRRIPDPGSRIPDPAFASRCADSSSSGCRSISASRRPATPIRPRRGSPRARSSRA